MIARTTLLAALSLFAPVDTDPLAGITDRAIDIELSGAPVRDVFLLLADVAETKISFDACVAGTIDLKLDNVGVRMLMTQLGGALGLVYRREGDTLAVGCASAPEAESISIELRDVTPTTAFAALAPGATIEGCDDQRIDLEVSNATRAAVVAGIAAQLGAEVRWDEGALHVACG